MLILPQTHLQPLSPKRLPITQRQLFSLRPLSFPAVCPSNLLPLALSLSRLTQPPIGSGNGRSPHRSQPTSISRPTTHCSRLPGSFSAPSNFFPPSFVYNSSSEWSQSPAVSSPC